MSELEPLFAKLFEVRAADDAFSGEFYSSPHNPFDVADEIAALGPRIVPELLGSLVDPERRRYVVHALAQLGPAAGPTAFAALARWFESDASVATALWRIDPDQARGLGLHRLAASREAIIRHVARQGFPALSRHLATLLEDGVPDVFRFALRGELHATGDPELVTLARRRPELVPVDLVRALARAGEPAATRVLAWLHLPEDAPVVLRALLDGALAPNAHDIAWLGPLPEAGGLVAHAAQFTAGLVARRRAAGLDTDVAAARAYVARTIPADHVTTFRAALQAAVQLRDPQCCEDLLRVIGHPELPFDLFTAAFAVLGDDGRALASRASVDGDRERQRLGWLRDELARRRTPPRMTTAEGDERLRAGDVDEWDDGAYPCYANALLFGPSDAYAALQCAWIDRGYGTPITASRIAWLRGLGVRDETVLGELSVSPPPLHDRRLRDHRSGSYDEDREPLALAAEAAGFPSIAAVYWKRLGRPADEARARAAFDALQLRLRGAT